MSEILEITKALVDFSAESSEGKEVKLYTTREEGDDFSIAAEINNVDWKSNIKEFRK